MPASNNNNTQSNDEEVETFSELYNENKRLKADLKDATSKLDLWRDYVALIRPKFPGLGREDRITLALKHDIPTTTVELVVKLSEGQSSSNGK